MPDDAPLMRTAFSVRMTPRQEALFRAACARAGTTPTDVFRDAAEAFVATHTDQAAQETR